MLKFSGDLKTGEFMQSIKLKIKKHPFDYWLSKNSYYHLFNAAFYKFIIPKNSKVLHIGCRNGYLLNALGTSVGVGIEFDEQYLLFSPIFHSALSETCLH